MSGLLLGPESAAEVCGAGPEGRVIGPQALVVTRKVTAVLDALDVPYVIGWSLAGPADCIISGDGDLLVLSPFEGILILRPAEFVVQL